ncbi:glycosyltransferase family 4 protein [Brachybacterium aquaticum]|uniref:Glycosyltransferase involved in cell wall biosynthesis n=1 Tax=Brachybacterium aquaticum TaxID=1432564 RepID=A0A841AD36_9MICO|nr:glycosyltransferase family 4 protein [Brachybacterium aquaticum]MBB5832756.1 glycosyltransferase involved in cell wall biosynthesis [Brachybacterium aquaticum]
MARHILDATEVGIPGWRVVVVCPEGPLAEALRAQGSPMVTAAVSPADGTGRAVSEVRAVLRRLAPDLLHTHLAFADLIGVAAVTGLRSGRGERIRLVSTEHGISGVRGYFQPGRMSAAAKSAAHRARLHRTDHVIAVSESTREQILEQWGRGAPITVIRNEVDPPSDVPAPRPGLRVLSLARLAPEKRIDQLLRAMSLVVAEHPEATLTVAGDGPLRDDLERSSAELGLQNAVTFSGFVDSQDALASHDVVVQLSVWENLSYTLLDALSRGLGIVATDVGGNSEIIPAQCLVDSADVRTIADTIRRQGVDLMQRPSPEPLVGGRERMTGRIASIYEEAGR